MGRTSDLSSDDRPLPSDICGPSAVTADYGNSGKRSSSRLKSI
jgi:hypothetical protein